MPDRGSADLDLDRRRDADTDGFAQQRERGARAREHLAARSVAPVVRGAGDRAEAFVVEIALFADVGSDVLVPVDD